MPQELNPGTILANTYRIERILGQGGFGITYLAVDISLDRKVAIKEFFPKDYCDRKGNTSHVTLGTQSTAEFVNKLKAKFLKEAKNIAKFDYPGIIKIYAAFEENNTAYYVMDFIEGESLSSMVKRSGPLPENQALRYVEQVGKALEYVHGHRINHLDVKPANIMVRWRDDKAILIDFGLSKQYDSEGNQTSTTPTGISHGYAPMEQYSEGGVREFYPQTDLYSLAATLYYLLSGVVPPHAPRLVDDELTFPSTIPSRLIGPIAKAMSTGRRNRHTTVAQFLDELRQEQEEDEATVITSPESAREPEPEKSKKSKKKWYLMGGAGVILFVIVAIIRYFLPADDFGPANSYQYVDLGLSVKWATCNIGASSPSEYGHYFSWGELSPKDDYSKETSTHYGKAFDDISGSLVSDAASNNWGGGWRIPTKEEFEELIQKCDWRWIDEKGLCDGYTIDTNGYLVTGPNGNSIFLPGAGKEKGSELEDWWTTGYYWSSTPDNNNFAAYELYFKEGAYLVFMSTLDRYDGLPIRPVIDIE